MEKDKTNPSDRVFWSWETEDDLSSTSDDVEQKSNVLVIEGVIASQESWFFDTVTPKEFRQQLKERNGQDIVVKINSPGGDVFAGVSIYNDLMDHSGNVSVHVTGMAASIASVIAMAGDEVIMRPGSMMMIHNPWGGAIGGADEMEKYAKLLRQIKTNILDIYTARTNKSEKTISDLMDDETWFTAEEAVKEGFADSVVRAKNQKSKSVVENMSNVLTQMFNGKPAFAMNVSKKTFQDFMGKIDLKDSDAVLEEIKNMGKTRKGSSMEDETKTEAVVAEAQVEQAQTEEVAETVEQVAEEAKAEAGETVEAVETEEAAEAEEAEVEAEVAEKDEEAEQAESAQADMATLTEKVEALIAENKALQEENEKLKQAQNQTAQQANALADLLGKAQRVEKPAQAEDKTQTAITENAYISGLQQGLKG